MTDARQLLSYRLTSADEALQAATVLFQAASMRACVNRLYYACFYAISALMLLEGRRASKHSGVLGLFNRHWIKTGRMPIEAGRLCNTLFSARQEADYADLAGFPSEQVALWLRDTAQFVRAVRNLLEQTNPPD